MPLPGKGGLRTMTPHLAQPAVFGSSSRYWPRSSSRSRDEDSDDDDEDRRDRDSDEDEGETRQSHGRPHGKYRTLCVRLCDGYYFPISFSATRSRFDRDAQVCERSCPGQARLFVHPNPGGEAEDMVDLRGQPYRELKTAFLYRTQHMPSCRCKADPWDAAAREQHRVYALEAGARKGDMQAKAQLTELTAKMQRDRTAEASKKPPPPGTAGNTTIGPSLVDVPVADAPRSSNVDESERMGLGARAPRPTRDRSPRRDPDWMARALGRP